MTKGLILVTGACGRIGREVVKRLSNSYAVVGFELLKAIYASPKEELVPLDLGSDESVEQAFTHIEATYGKKIAAVVHLAAYYSFAKKHSPLYEAITVQGTARLLQRLQSLDVEQFLFTSTMLVHAPTKPGKPLREEDPLCPSWDYPLSKVHTEEKIQKLRGNIPSVLLRVAGVYDDVCHSIPISQQIKRIYEKQLQAHLFPGNISHGSSFLHMEDLVDAIESAIEKRKELPPYLPLLLGEETTLSYNTLQQEIASHLGQPSFRTFRIPKWIAKMGSALECALPFKAPPFIRPWMIDFADDHYELSIEKAKHYLGWHPKKNLRSTLPLMIQHLKNDPKKWYKIHGL